jgi:hypothetical protein
MTIEDKVILQKEKEEYDIFLCQGGTGPYHEGSTFRVFKQHFNSKPLNVDKHFLVEHHYVNGNGEDSDSIVGVAHNKTELKSRIFSCAKSYCLDYAEKTGVKFVYERKR